MYDLREGIHSQRADMAQHLTLLDCVLCQQINNLSQTEAVELKQVVFREWRDQRPVPAPFAVVAFLNLHGAAAAAAALCLALLSCMLLVGKPAKHQQTAVHNNCHSTAWWACGQFYYGSTASADRATMTISNGMQRPVSCMALTGWYHAAGAAESRRRATSHCRPNSPACCGTRS